MKFLKVVDLLRLLVKEIKLKVKPKLGKGS